VLKLFKKTELTPTKEVIKMRTERSYLIDRMELKLLQNIVQRSEFENMRIKVLESRIERYERDN